MLFLSGLIAYEVAEKTSESLSKHTDTKQIGLDTI